MQRQARQQRLPSSSLAHLAPGWAVVHCDIIKDDFWNARPHLVPRETECCKKKKN